MTEQIRKLLLPEVVGIALTIYGEHERMDDLDAMFDGGEFSGPSHARSADKEVQELAERHGFTLEQVQAELSRTSILESVILMRKVQGEGVVKIILRIEPTGNVVADFVGDTEVARMFGSTRVPTPWAFVRLRTQEACDAFATNVFRQVRDKSPDCDVRWSPDFAAELAAFRELQKSREDALMNKDHVVFENERGIVTDLGTESGLSIPRYGVWQHDSAKGKHQVTFASNDLEECKRRLQA